ncbi:MAG: hypothetical protein ACP5FT_00675 [Acidilobus sp.]
MGQELNQLPGTVSGKLVWAVVGFFALLSAGLGFVASYSGPLATGVVIDVGLLLYIIALLSYTKARFVPLGLMLGADIGHLIYDVSVLDARVVLYPLIEVLVSVTGHVSYNVDVVQTIVFAEVIYAVYRAVTRTRRKTGTYSGQSPPTGQGIS